jgi:hypothetical protein
MFGAFLGIKKSGLEKMLSHIDNRAFANPL